MPSPINIGTRDIPLKLAKLISDRVNKSWESGEILANISPISQDLLKFWFKEPHIESRYINFHQGQKQAILNTIFLHEMLGTKTVKAIYEQVQPELLLDIDIAELKKTKYEIPKYAIKMATGTGKTWVMHALLIWQYLNAKYELENSGKFTKNFLFVAPGLIVYERLLDAFLGKEDVENVRDFEQSDIFKFKELLIPQSFREDVFGFVQNSVAKKEEIGTKSTGDGMIAIANWHLFMEKEEETGSEVSPLDSPEKIVKDLRPIAPGKTGGNDLNSLDAEYLSGHEIDFLANLKDLMVMNDEAHHIHENSVYGEIKEVEWQKSLNKIAKKKGDKFIQTDFSATPYDVSGSGQKRVKHYFPHVITDFDLKTAIRGGLVKTIAIDKRKEIVDLPLDYNAIRDGNKVIGLSDGQKLMIRAGLSKLKLLESQFVNISKDETGKSDKYPKMLVVCEDTTVSPFVVEFIKQEGHGEDDVIQVDSNRKGEIPEDEWLVLKQKLFNIDKSSQPKVIVSVLMLREGFDVNNICVIVPLRATTAPILLEQTIGRGLRLMWREPEYVDLKHENIRKLLVEKVEPTNYLDMLTIVEHPAFIQFYDDLLKEGLATEIEHDPKGGVTGDIIKVGLKTNYKDYDLFWPVVVSDDEEEMIGKATLDLKSLDPFTVYPLGDLKIFFKKSGEEFISEELTVKTRFGEYLVDASLFTAQSYNEYLQRILNVVTNRIAKVGPRKTKAFPTLQVDNLEVVGLIDKYIRTRLFGVEFNPFSENNWKILLLRNGIVTQHIVKEVGKIILSLQNNVAIDKAKIIQKYFSEVTELRMRENYSLDISKTIYEKLAYPSNRGEFEKNLMIYADADSKVISLIKVDEYYHQFAHVLYIRIDGLLSTYHPDFIVRTSENIYVVETKSDRDVNDLNVKQKQIAILDWIEKVNGLEEGDRGNSKWEYILLSESHFYGLSENGASILEIFELSKLNKAALLGRLF